MANTENLNIYQKLALIGEPARALQKNKKGYNYRYVSEDVILERITGLMKKHQVSLIPNIVRGTTCITPYHYTKTKSTNKGDIYEEHVNEILVNADMNWTWVNNANPDEKITIPWTFIGQQSDASQAFGSGLTYSSRYFLLKYFNISTLDDDPDKWRSRQKEFEEEEDRIIAEKITEEIDSYIEVPNMQNNITAVLQVMKFIYENIMYAELNTKSDFCQCCGYNGEINIVEDENSKLIWQCPNCGNIDQNKMNVARRTCGYIGTQFWNQGRTQEIKERVLHL